MRVTDAVSIGKGIILVGERREISFDLDRRDQIGIMYYPYAQADLNQTSTVFMSGGLDGSDLLDRGLVGQLYLQTTLVADTLIIGSRSSSSLKSFSISDPLIAGKP